MVIKKISHILYIIIFSLATLTNANATNSAAVAAAFGLSVAFVSGISLEIDGDVYNK